VLLIIVLAHASVDMLQNLIIKYTHSIIDGYNMLQILN
jgi:hypothetical protein